MNKIVNNPPTDYRGRVIEQVSRGKEGATTNPLWLSKEARAIQRHRYFNYSEQDLRYILNQLDYNRYAGEPQDLRDALNHNLHSCKEYEYRTKNRFGIEQWRCSVCGKDVNIAE